MGYASTYEAIAEKLADLAHLAERATQELPRTAMPRDRGVEFARLLAEAHGAIEQLSSWLELATNPVVDLGRELHEARDVQREMATRIASYERTCVALTAALNRERKATDVLREKLTTETQKTRNLERALEEKVRAEPASVYGAYAPSTREIRKKSS